MVALPDDHRADEQAELVDEVVREQPSRQRSAAVHLQPALDAVARWGAAGMREPRHGERVTDASLVTALRVAADRSAVPDRKVIAYTIKVGDAVAQATVGDGTIDIAPGKHPDPDLAITAGPGLRGLFAEVFTVPHSSVVPRG